MNCEKPKKIHSFSGQLLSNLDSSVFKEGWLRHQKKFPFLSGADGVVSKFQQK